MLKVDLNLKSIYGENMDLSKYYKVFVAQVKVAWVAGINFGSKTVVSLIQDKRHVKDSVISRAPAHHNPLIKFEPGMKLKELWKVVHYNTAC